MSAHAEVTPWGQFIGYCTRCTETISGNPSRVQLWADVHDSVAHWTSEPQKDPS
jgi:hypothetical protein